MWVFHFECNILLFFLFFFFSIFSPPFHFPVFHLCFSFPLQHIPRVSADKVWSINVSASKMIKLVYLELNNKGKYIPWLLYVLLAKKLVFFCSFSVLKITMLFITIDEILITSNAICCMLCSFKTSIVYWYNTIKLDSLYAKYGNCLFKIKNGCQKFKFKFKRLTKN